jgi:hypothetical protein
VPFEVQCDSCGRKFRAPDKLAGKRVKCPQCQAVLTVGVPSESRPAEKPAQSKAAAQPTTPAQRRPQAKSPQGQKKLAVAKPVETASPQEVAEWHVQTGGGEEYGPVTKSELDSWVGEGRLDGNCQVLKEGWDQWKWADDVYPELATAPPSSSAAPSAQNAFAGIGAAIPAPSADVNPFVSPQAAPTVGVVASDSDQEAITPRLRRALAETRPWVMFLAILGMVLGGLGTLSGLGFLVLFSLAAGARGMLIGLAMLVAPALYIVAAYYLLSYGLKIGNFLRSSSVRELEGAMIAQKSFWKLIGIITAVVLALYVLVIILMVALGAFAASAIHSGMMR